MGVRATYTYTNSQGVTKATTVQWSTAVDRTLKQILTSTPPGQWETVLQQIFETITSHGHITWLDVTDDGGWEVKPGVVPSKPAINPPPLDADRLLDGLYVTYDARTPQSVTFTHRKNGTLLPVVETVTLHELAEGWESAYRNK